MPAIDDDDVYRMLLSMMMNIVVLMVVIMETAMMIMATTLLMLMTTMMTDLYRVGREVYADEGVKEPVDGHKLGEPQRLKFLGGVQIVADEGSLRVLPLLGADLVTAVEHLDVEEVGDNDDSDDEYEDTTMRV